jgi:predicted aspartyl protease
MPVKLDSATEAMIESASKDYWSVRDTLMAQYQGKWVAMVGTVLVAAGGSPLAVIAEARKGGHMRTFIQRVGYEDKTEFKIRRITFDYDATYNDGIVPIPRARLTLKNILSAIEKNLEDVILDTGADVTCMPESDCDAAQLRVAGEHYLETKKHGQQPSRSVFHEAIVEIDGKNYSSLVERVADGEERILGRDVLNQLKATFDGPSGKVTIE